MIIKKEMGRTLASIKYEKNKPAIFLDRDGVLVEEKGYIVSIKDLNIFPYAKECVSKIKEKGYCAIVITNQSGVARGLLSEEKLKEINHYLLRATGIDAIYYCPHHPNGKVSAYSKSCICRKPAVGLFQRACEDYHIDMHESYMVGDRACDIKAGQNAGIKTVLLETGYGTERLEEAVQPDYVFQNLEDFVNCL